jgi:deoxyadenosine/deoxycytidine kinase
MILNKMTPTIIYVEGNIGTGKSTFLKQLDVEDLKLKYKYDIVYEPVEEWQTIGILDQFYKDPQRYCYLFQSYCLFSRFRLLKRIDKKELKFIFIERSIFSDKNVFANGCKQIGQLNDLEYEIYNNWFNHFNSIHPTDYHHIYLQLDPETCLQRINKRNRGEESGITLDYLQLLHDQHESWTKNNKKVIKIYNNEGILDTMEILTDIIENCVHDHPS